MAFIHRTPYEDGMCSVKILPEDCVSALATFLHGTRAEVATGIIQMFHDARIIHSTDLRLRIANATTFISPQPAVGVSLSAAPAMTSIAKVPKAAKAPKVAGAVPKEKKPKVESKIECVAIKKDNSKCTNAAKPGTQYCGVHAP